MTSIDPANACSSHGTILVSIVLDNLGSVLASPKISTIGVYDSATIDRLSPGVSQAVSDAIDDLDDDQVNDNARIDQVVRTAIRQSLALPRYRRPIVEIQTTRFVGRCNRWCDRLPYGGHPLICPRYSRFHKSVVDGEKDPCLVG